MSAQQLFNSAVRRPVKLLWQLALVRLLVYMGVTCGSEFLIATYNVPWSKMDVDQALAVKITLFITAGNIMLSFLDQSIKTIESGGDLPPELPRKAGTDTTTTQTAEPIKPT